AEDGIRDFHVTGVQTCALPIFAACSIKVLPTSVEPVKVIFRISGLVANSSPRPLLSLEVMTEKTPFGTPAISANFANASAVKGRSEERRVGKGGQRSTWEED